MRSIAPHERLFEIPSLTRHLRVSHLAPSDHAHRSWPCLRVSQQPVSPIPIKKRCRGVLGIHENVVQASECSRPLARPGIAHRGNQAAGLTIRETRGASNRGVKTFVGRSAWTRRFWLTARQLVIYHWEVGNRVIRGTLQ